MQVATSTSAPTVDRAIFRRGVRLVVSYVRMHPKPFAAAVAGAVLFAFASLWLTEALARATDEVLAPAFEGDLDTSKVWLAVGGLMLGGIGRALGIMVRRYYSGVAGERVMATLRTRVAERYRALSLRYHRETPTGELLAHMEADVKAAVDVFWPVPFAMGVIVLTGLALIALLTTDPVLALVGLFVFPTLAIMNQIFARRMEEPTRLAQERIGEVSAVAHESIDGALVVKTLGREQAETQRLLREGAGAPRRARALGIDPRDVRGRARRPADPRDRAAARRRVVARVDGRHHARRPDRVRGALPAAGVADAVHRLDPRRAPARGRRATTASRRSSSEPVTVTPVREGTPLPEGPLGLHVHDLRLEYEQQSPVLEGVTFEVAPGESVAIVGPTGVGKSTLTQLMVRLVDPDQGHVEIGGVDLRQVDVASLRGVGRGRVPGELPVRGERAVEHRAGLGRDATNEVEHAAVIAACDRFIRALPDGLRHGRRRARAHRCRAASASAWRSRGRWCASRGC